ncbi:MAG: SoxR reducing system RseC family protein [Hydrogenophilus sp.]|nr:SoxR reducing system RseC family protein [Hydrogenophilus sp.]
MKTIPVALSHGELPPDAGGVPILSRIVAIGDGTLTLELFPSPACGSCSTSLLCRAARPQRLTLTLSPHPLPWRVGDRVQLSLPRGKLLSLALRIYLIPTLLILAAAFALSALGGSDTLIALALPPIFLGTLAWAARRPLPPLELTPLDPPSGEPS